MCWEKRAPPKSWGGAVRWSKFLELLPGLAGLLQFVRLLADCWMAWLCYPAQPRKTRSGTSKNTPKIEVFSSYKVVFVADVGSVLLGLSLHGLALLAALEKAHFLGSQSKFQELRSASGFKRALDPRSKNARVRPARASPRQLIPELFLLIN